MVPVKRLPSVLLLFLLGACAAAPGGAVTPSQSAFELTKMYPLTVEAATITAGYPKNGATITAIMATKSAGGTAMAETMTAMPSETPVPTIPPDSPYCRPGDLKTTFSSMGATQNILIDAGLTNASVTPCFLRAWPQVLLAGRQGQPVDVDYHYFEMGPADDFAAATEAAQQGTTAKVGVWPGWIAWIRLIWSNWCGEPVAGGVVIQLTLGDNAGKIAIPTNIQSGGACNASGYRSTVGISKIEPATPSR